MVCDGPRTLFYGGSPAVWAAEIPGFRLKGGTLRHAQKASLWSRLAEVKNSRLSGAQACYARSTRISGSRTVTVVPTSSWLTRSKVPPCISVIDLAKGRPRPVPSNERFMCDSTCPNGIRARSFRAHRCYQEFIKSYVCAELMYDPSLNKGFSTVRVR